MSAEDCDREVDKGIHGVEYQIVLQNQSSWAATCIAERCYEHKCTSKILWLLPLMRHTVCLNDIYYQYMNSGLFYILQYMDLHNLFLCIKGAFFRKEFSRLGEVRSLIPPHVHMIALTVTATFSTRNKVITTLRMVDPYIHLTLHTGLPKRTAGNYFCPIDFSTKKTTQSGQHSRVH